MVAYSEQGLVKNIVHEMVDNTVLCKYDHIGGKNKCKSCALCLLASLSLPPSLSLTHTLPVCECVCNRERLRCAALGVGIFNGLRKKKASKGLCQQVAAT